MSSPLAGLGRLAGLAASSLTLIVVAACSSETSTPDGGTSSGDAGSSGSSGDGGSSGNSSSGDSGTASVNGCTSFKDETAAGAQGVTIPWSLSIGSNELHCVKVKVGTTVTFEGSFTSHPLAPLGGDTPSPFDGISARIESQGTPEERAPTELKTAGTFGYTCTVHAVMKGAVLVVP